MSPYPIPTDFAQTIGELYGASGTAWLEDLPRLIAECEQRWSLQVEAPFDLSYNYVAPAVRADGLPVVLKLGVPNPELTCEVEALRLYAGRGMVQLLDADPARGILLLERLKPGRMLLEMEDDRRATSIAAGLMRQLWRPLPADHPFPTVEKWAQGLQRLRARFNGGCGPFPAKLVERAERLFAELLASSAAARLLHGDLHHENILAAERQPWLALDPKGLAGEPAYETGALLRNPRGIEKHPQLKRLQARRVAQLAEELRMDRQRIAGWGFAQAVLSAWWSFEDHGYGWEPTLAVAESLEAS